MCRLEVNLCVNLNVWKHFGEKIDSKDLPCRKTLVFFVGTMMDEMFNRYYETGHNIAKVWAG